MVPLLSPLVVTIVLGAAFANVVGLPERAAPDVAAHALILEMGIVLLGASLSLEALITAARYSYSSSSVSSPSGSYSSKRSPGVPASIGARGRY